MVYWNLLHRCYPLSLPDEDNWIWLSLEPVQRSLKSTGWCSIPYECGTEGRGMEGRAQFTPMGEWHGRVQIGELLERSPTSLASEPIAEILCRTSWRHITEYATLGWENEDCCKICLGFWVTPGIKAAIGVNEQPLGCFTLWEAPQTRISMCYRVPSQHVLCAGACGEAKMGPLM